MLNKFLNLFGSNIAIIYICSMKFSISFIISLSLNFIKILYNFKDDSTNLVINLNIEIMKSLKVNYQGKDYTLNLPTMFAEVDMNYLQSLVANVNVAPHYSIVAILIKERPTIIISSLKQNKNSTVSGIPVMIKHNSPDNDFMKGIKLGDKLNVAGSDLAIGYHVAAKGNSLSPTFLARLAIDDKNIYTDCLNINEGTYFVEFKIIPNNAIHAAINNDSKLVIDTYFVEDNGND